MPTRSLPLIVAYLLAARAFGLGAEDVGPRPVRWDYERHPVRIAPPPALPGPLSFQGETVSAFDGYGAQGVRPGATRAWRVSGLPSEESPHACEIDYGRPVAVSAFVHYFYVPDGPDYRYVFTGPSAFKRVRVLSRDEGTTWSEVSAYDDLPAFCPQVLPVAEARPARHWRIEILELAPGAGSLISYEIETYTGGVPSIEPGDPWPNLPAAFAERMRQHRPTTGDVSGELQLQEDGLGVSAVLKHAGRTADCRLELLVGDEPVRLQPDGESGWRGELPHGTLRMRLEPTFMGPLLNLSHEASVGQPVRFERVSLRMKTDEVQLYYVPAYAWSRQPVETMAASCNVQTRFAGLSTGEMTVCLVPGTDRGHLGLLDEAAQNNLLLGPEPTPVLLTAVCGDWWDAYRFAVREIYAFTEPPQSVPVSEIQYGISRYLMSEEVWEPRLGTLKSWPERDPHTKLVGTDYFVLYGPPYSIPAYLARHVMNGDRQALERARSIVRWLCQSSVRVSEGPATGAFYTLQRFAPGEPVGKDKPGMTQGWGVEYLTSQSTGAALWSLLYYRRVTGEKDPELDQVIDEAAEWLLTTQLPDGGWPYGHDRNGKAVENASPSSGCIWNIWSLWRLGRETGVAKFTEAAERATRWYAEEFVRPHHYHGYWEDVGPGSREGYEAAIATVAFSEMGEKDLAIETARDAIQWVYTRQIEPREPSCSAGLVAEQTGWPPAAYCNPMMGLAAWTAWRASGDPFWQPFAMIPKAVGWWYQPETGASVWIVDATMMAPVAGPVFESWWSDWCIGQVGALTMRWLVREVGSRAGGSVEIDEETLQGTVLGRPVRCWAPPGGLRPRLPLHGQVNWLGFRGEESVLVAFFNHGPPGHVLCPLNSRDVNGAILQPKCCHHSKDGNVTTAPWDGETPVAVEQHGVVLLEWCVTQ